VTPSRRYAHRRISLSVAMGLVSFTTVLSYMGLPEFAVATAAETEILHELTMEPAHNHVGKMRTVPYAQLVPGAYTTLQLESDNPRAAVEEFNEEMAGRIVWDPNQEGGKFVTEYDFVEFRLTSTDHLINMPASFRTVPDDAPQLYSVLKTFAHELEERHGELPGARGMIVVSDYQPGLRRVDMAIIWDGVEIENGRAKLDETGNPIPLLVRDAEGNVRMMQDADGNVLLDEAGNPIPVQERRIYTRHIYLHVDSAYFD
jgi:hypothetical protein